MAQEDTLSPERKTSALQRSEVFSRALAETARRFRMSKRSRRAAGLGGFRARRHARVYRIFFIVSFFAVALIPSLAAITYFGLIASPQYAAEARFAVRTGELPKIDGMGALTGIPVAKIAQDTQVVTNYMQSRAIVEALEQRLGLRNRYTSDDIDWVARFRRDRPIEKFVDYWKSMTDASIQPGSGIVTFSVHAFSASDARDIANAVIDLSEALVNDMNSRMLRATVSDAEREFARSAERLSHARIEFQKVRNSEGTIDAGQAGKALIELVTALRGERLRLQQEYETQSKYVSTSAPQMRTLSTRLVALDDQIADLEAKLTTQRVTATGDHRTISESLTRFAERDLERRIAERQYAVAAGALELARATSQRQLVYLAAFVRPALPEESKYPKRILWSVCAVLGSLSLWGVLCGIATLMRNHMA